MSSPIQAAPSASTKCLKRYMIDYEYCGKGLILLLCSSRIDLDGQHHWTHRKATFPWKYDTELEITPEILNFTSFKNARVIASDIPLENRLGENSILWICFASHWLFVMPAGDLYNIHFKSHMANSGANPILPRLHDDPTASVSPCIYGESKPSEPPRTFYTEP